MALGSLVILVAATDARADAGTPSADSLVLDLGGATLEARKVSHGSFTMGSPSTEPGHDKDEQPTHQVTITKDFWMGKYPVTRGQYAKFVADTRYVTEAEKGQSGGSGWDPKAADAGKAPGLVQRKEFSWRSPGFAQTEDHPVVLVTFGDANAFTAWVSRKTGKRVRLPSEAEWELAVRAGTSTAWYGGANPDTDPSALGWFKNNAGNGTRLVGRKKPNALGLFDMSGNVFEWCRDVYAPYRDGPAVDPESTTRADTEPERHVLRGGSWLRDYKRSRSAARYRNTAGSRNADNGFRVVITDEEVLGPGLTGAGGALAPASPLGASGGAAGPAGAASGAAPIGPTSRAPARGDPTSRASEVFSWGLLLASPIAAASAVIAWMLLRRKRTAADAAVAGAPSPRASTRAVADGFFVSAPNVTPGTRVRYECTVNGTLVSDLVPLDGGAETFVYTGAHPTAIRILEIIPGARGSYRTPDRPRTTSAQGSPAQRHESSRAVAAPFIDTSDPSSSSTFSSDEPFFGSPRAY